MTEDYKTLRRVLDEAYDQAANGKGKERHANDKPFDEQPIMRITEMLQGTAGPLFQAMKKIQEANSMSLRGEADKAIHELRGTIVYTAAAIAYLESKDPPVGTVEVAFVTDPSHALSRGLADLPRNGSAAEEKIVVEMTKGVGKAESPKTDKQIVPVVGNYYRRIGDPIRKNVVQVVSVDEYTPGEAVRVHVESVRSPEKVKYGPIELSWFNANYEFVDRYDRLD